ncbi:MAG: HAD-IC family P-type ATPase [Syntrophomonadaceae bacterium]|nr:HAD-IC family P-type ATPase [Syntrophomonadaceae bacterium]
MARRRESAGVPWHALAGGEVLARLGSSLAGLGEEEVAARQERYGRNVLPAGHVPSLPVVILHQFLSPLIYVLVAAAALSVAIGDDKDALFILGVVLLNAAIGAFQEWKAETSAAALQSLLKTRATVRRAGVEKDVDAEELVPGDIVLLESGQRVPADLRLLSVNNLGVDESFLTGESLAQAKNAEVLPDEQAPVADRSNMAFAGGTVLTGRGVGIVVATGPDSEVGRIARSVSEAEAAKPPLVLRMEKFSRQVSLVVLGASAMLAVVAFSRGMAAAEVFFLAVALAVSAIPEGLPVAMTVALSVATSRMARRNVIVRRLTAVEGLGSCTYIASDKTGTLTVNQQTVRLLQLPGGERFTVTGEGYAGQGEVLPEEGGALSAAEAAHLQMLVRAAVLCNEAGLTHDPASGEWQHHGDAMDVALLALAFKLGMDPHEVRRRVITEGEIPFESERRYAAQFYRENGEIEAAVKGAVEAVLPFCDTMLTAGGPRALDAEAIAGQAQDLAEKGFRVLAVATGRAGQGVELPAPAAHQVPRLTLLGLVGFIDPLRPEAREAVERCRRAGIEVAMVTGDHPATALAIARELGIADWSKEVVTGAELEELGDPQGAAFCEKIRSARVFARVTPLQKLYIVNALIQAGHFVAVTGDGVNDAPALRRAHIGVAMGSGTDVAKDAASIIVVDDNFASIEAGVEEGRFAYDNVRKVTYLLISTGLAEVVLFALALLFSLPIPLVAVQLLWLNLVTNGIQDVALAFEGGEPGALERPPRKPQEGIFNRLMINQVAVSGLTMAGVAFLAWFWLLHSGWEEAQARNLLLLLMVLMENVHVFNCRSERESVFDVPISRNYLLVGGVLAAQGVHQLASYLPVMQRVLGVAPVSLAEWGTMAFMALAVLLVMELFKVLMARRSEQAGQPPA